MKILTISCRLSLGIKIVGRRQGSTQLQRDGLGSRAREET